MSTDFADRKLAYREFLKSDKWQDFRLQKLVSVKGLCWGCGKEGWNHDVHHVIYRKNWNDVVPEDVIALCRDCHCRVHAILDQYKEINELQTVNERLGAIKRYLKELRVQQKVGVPIRIFKQRCTKEYVAACKMWKIPLAPFPRLDALVEFYLNCESYDEQSVRAFFESATTKTHCNFPKREPEYYI